VKNLSGFIRKKTEVSDRLKSLPGFLLVVAQDSGLILTGENQQSYSFHHSLMGFG